MEDSKDINDACKLIRGVWPELRNSYNMLNPGHYLEVTAVYRSPATQFEYYKKGRIFNMETGLWEVLDSSKVITQIDGKTKLGAHNYSPSRAIDVVVVSNRTGKRLWDEEQYYCLVEIARSYGLESGGEWKNFKDWPHLQVPNYKDYKEV